MRGLPNECSRATAPTKQLTHEEPQQQIRVRPWRFVGNSACPRAYGAKRVRVRIREKEGFTHPSVWRVLSGAKNWDLHARDTNSPVVGKRFLCFVSLSPLDKEMKCRHAQWLIAIKNLANIEHALT